MEPLYFIIISAAGGLIGSIIAAAVGAVVLLWIAGLLKKQG